MALTPVVMNTDRLRNSKIILIQLSNLKEISNRTSYPNEVFILEFLL